MKTSAAGRFLCARTDPHPSDFGGDLEGHEWVPATPAEWAAAEVRLDRAWAAAHQDGAQ